MATQKPQDPWKVEIFVHAIKGYVVWMHTGKHIYDQIRTRKRNEKQEVVMYGKKNVATQCAVLLPINAEHHDIPSVVTYSKWHSKGFQKIIDEVITKARVRPANSKNIGIVKFKDFVEGNIGGDSTFKV